mgnify:CR=1 FL=1
MSDLRLPQNTKEAVMQRAVELGETGFGRTAPNPCVGAVITRNGAVVAEGYHTACGAPHAEVEAIAQARAAGVDLPECTLWVTLEPCNHHGRTPPCTKAIIEAGIRSVGIGTLDPNPHVGGGGTAFLRDQGVEVEVGILEPACRDLIADFLLWQQEKRPGVLLKLAATLDGKIATRSGHSAWVSGPEAREEVHGLRGRVDGVLVGGGTLRADNPRLTCRSERALNKQPLALVVTSRLPEAQDNLHLLRHRPQETIFWTTDDQSRTPQADALRALGCRIWDLPLTASGMLDLRAGLTHFFDQGLGHTILCEGGGRLALALAEQGLADRLRLYLAPKILGDATAINLFSGRDELDMGQALPWRFTRSRQVGADMCLELRPQTQQGAARNGAPESIPAPRSR